MRLGASLPDAILGSLATRGRFQAGARNWVYKYTRQRHAGIAVRCADNTQHWHLNGGRMVWPVFVMLATVNHFCWETQQIYVNTQCRILSSCLLNKDVKINNLKASIKLYCRTSQRTKCASTRWVLLEPCRTLHCAGSTEFLVVRVVITRLWRVNVYRSVIILVLWHPDRRTLTGVVVNIHN